jgi:ER lumen protein retaining receptor
VTQLLYLVVCLTRYTDLLTDFYSIYNSIMKIFFIAIEVCLIMKIRRSDRDPELDNFPAIKFLVLPCLLLTLVHHSVDGSFDQLFGWPRLVIQKFLWQFSIYLEALVILPQLSLLKRYRVVENLTGNYVFLLGIYRFLYIINWIYRANYEPFYRHHYAVYVSGVVQVLLYIEFFYYWVISKMRRRPLSYGDEGDIEYFDYNVDELRNSENTESLLENSTSDNLRMRGTRDRSNNDDDDETQPILVV